MIGLLVVLVLVVPVIELVVFIAVAGQIGGLSAAALVILCSIAGFWLVKREGLGVWRKAEAKMRAGEMPATELLNGLLVLLAGLLMVVPGFVTDAVALLLLIPPVRALVRRLVFRRFEQQLQAMAEDPAASMFGTGRRRIYTGRATYQTVDVAEVDVTRVDVTRVDVTRVDVTRVTDVSEADDDRRPGGGRPELER